MANHAIVTWKEGKHFEGISRGHVLQMDAPLPSGQDIGMTPVDLLVVAVGGCTGMDVVHILQKERQEITGLTVEVHGERALEEPTVFTDIHVSFKVRGHNLSKKAVEHAVKLSEDKYCCVGIMLGKTARMTSEIEIEEG